MLKINQHPCGFVKPPPFFLPLVYFLLFANQYQVVLNLKTIPALTAKLVPKFLDQRLQANWSVERKLKLINFSLYTEMAMLSKWYPSGMWSDLLIMF